MKCLGTENHIVFTIVVNDKLKCPEIDVVNCPKSA